MNVNLSVGKILKEHEALKNGNKVVFYDKDTFKEIQCFLRDMYSSEDEKECHFVYDYGYDYRPWNDGVHASCFVCWCNHEGTQYMRGFDCYV